MYGIHIPWDKVDVVYSCRLLAPEELLEYSLSIFGASNRVSNGPLVEEDLPVIATLDSDQYQVLRDRTVTTYLVCLVTEEVYFLKALVLDIS